MAKGEKNGNTSLSSEKKVPNQSNIQSVELDENVGGGRGANTTVSVLVPEIRIERTKKEKYLIVVTFTLQVKIHAFEIGFTEPISMPHANI